jgi:hypothetical protein
MTSSRAANITAGYDDGNTGWAHVGWPWECRKISFRGSAFLWCTIIVIFVHFVARSFCVKIKFPKEMPKIAKCLKCLKLRYSIDFIKRKKQGMRLYSFTDFWFFMLKIPGVYNKDGATRRHNFRHFRHFSSL